MWASNNYEIIQMESLFFVFYMTTLDMEMFHTLIYKRSTPKTLQINNCNVWLSYTDIKKTNCKTPFTLKQKILNVLYLLWTNYTLNPNSRKPRVIFINLCPLLKSCASLPYRPTRSNYLSLPFPKVGRDWQGSSKEVRVCLLGTNNKIGCKYSRNFTLSDEEMEIRRTTAEKI